MEDNMQLFMKIEAVRYLKQHMTMSEKTFDNLLARKIIEGIESPGFRTRYRRKDLERLVRDGFVRATGSNGASSEVVDSLPVAAQAPPDPDPEPGILTIDSPAPIIAEIRYLLQNTGKFKSETMERMIREKSPSWIRGYVAHKEAAGWPRND